MIAFVVSLLVAGSFTTWIGYYSPTMVLGSILMSVGAGLTTTWHPLTGLGEIIGYNAIFGLGCGFAFQQPFIAVQTVLDQEDVPSGIVILEFAQYLGSIVALAISQTLFTNTLISNLVANVPQIDPSVVVNTGALDLKNAIPAQYSMNVLTAYADALDKTYYVGTALSCITIIGALGVKWQSVKKEEKEKGSDREKDVNKSSEASTKGDLVA
jgi:MFS family permease